MCDVRWFGRASGWKLFLIAKTFIDLWSGDWQEPRPLCVTVTMATCLTPNCHALSCPRGLNVTGHRLRKYCFIVSDMNSSLLITLTCLIRQEGTQKIFYTITCASFYSVKLLSGFRKYCSGLCKILNAYLILLVCVYYATRCFSQWLQNTGPWLFLHRLFNDDRMYIDDNIKSGNGQYRLFSTIN